MVLVPTSLPMEVGDVQWMNEVGWPILALVGAFTLSLYLWSYLRKNFEIWKAHEGRYFDSEVLDASRRMGLIFIISLLAISTYVVLSIVLKWTTHPSWPGITINIFKLLAILIILLVAQLLVLILNRIARRSRANAGSHKAMPSALEFSTLLVSYTIYIGSIILVLLIAASMFMSLDEVFGGIVEFIQDNKARLIVTALIIVGIFLAIRLEKSILEDVKFRTKKFNPQVIDLLSAVIRYALIIIGLLVVIFDVFSMIGMETVGILLVVVTLIFICLGITLSYSTIQNVVSGLALMDTNPFEAGDRIIILDSMMCDVLEKGLIFTKVRTLDGEIVDVPNNEILQGRIYNYSRGANHAISVMFEVSFELSHAKVENYVKEAIVGIEGILKEPRPSVRALEIKGSNIQYEVEVFTKDVQKDPAIRSAIIAQIQDIFHTEGYKRLIG
ncbi:MAG: mechanosensitive ion channel family protein [Methanomassiliicoccus sp.]|nr:mechanosensitive ion channel family protein [Methanomassiliicoccus sp.]